MPNITLTKDFLRLTLEHKKHIIIKVRNIFKNGVCYYINSAVCFSLNKMMDLFPGPYTELYMVTTCTLNTNHCCPKNKIAWSPYS